MSVSTLEHIHFDFLKGLGGLKEPLELPMQKPVPSRCELDGCKKKLGLLPIQCKCKGYYCAAHRGDSVHACSYDYHAEHKAQLSTSMVKVGGKKLETL